MTSDIKIRQIWFNLFQDLYIHCEPELDFIEFFIQVEKTGDCPTDWFKQHSMPESEYTEIVDFWLKGLTHRENKVFNWELLKYAPKTTTGQEEGD